MHPIAQFAAEACFVTVSTLSLAQEQMAGTTPYETYCSRYSRRNMATHLNQ
jgi:hypothetical protein